MLNRSQGLLVPNLRCVAFAGSELEQSFELPLALTPPPRSYLHVRAYFSPQNSKESAFSQDGGRKRHLQLKLCARPVLGRFGYHAFELLSKSFALIIARALCKALIFEMSSFRGHSDMIYTQEVSVNDPSRKLLGASPLNKNRKRGSQMVDRRHIKDF